MPELPEVQTVLAGIEPVLVGKKIERISTHRADVRVPFPDRLHELEGHIIHSLTRRAKYILIHIADYILVLHLGMSGRVTIEHDLRNYALKKHDHMDLLMQDGTGIVFNDPRRFGMVLLVKKGEIQVHPSFRSIGPEPLSRNFTGKILHAALRKKKTAIKVALLDQRLVAGVGNIYACEALYAAGIDPQRTAGSLTPKQTDALVLAVKDVLKRAIAAGGSSLKDYRKSDGTLGYFQHGFAVYDREGQACPKGKTGATKGHIIKRITQAGRSTFYCPFCQK
ncbi:MAG: DNA-formamidopyrimidine glycosylase [Micavibrio aeruginosavorus]|uniref:Formamidopyrimidine-DNA glycosylase n=1 Tax=Micavibrio aeruginosavorus TaxID=349221 RepID=A0A2W5N0M3_9BACT|nr:MAG: DNA-formamidopyrimidine glycosylase [Micavibrio aeruginosavorus]